MTAIIEQASIPSLDGITLEAIVRTTIREHGLGSDGHRCASARFKHDTSIKYTLKFLRRTPWARKKVEQLYLRQARR